MNEINELEEMRKQLGKLKCRLDRESTLNEQLVHDSLRMKMRSVHKTVRKVVTIGLLGVAAWLYVGSIWNLSPYFVTFTCLMMLVSITTEYFVNRMDDESFSTNLTDTVVRLVNMKKMRLRKTIIGCSVILVVWMPWLVYEFSQHFDGQLFRSTMIGVGVGFVLGLCAGLRILFKMQRANDEMIRQIEEFTKECK